MNLRYMNLCYMSFINNTWSMKHLWNTLFIKDIRVCKKCKMNIKDVTINYFLFHFKTKIIIKSVSSLFYSKEV